MGKLILVRHGKSYWNIEKIFTGWTDIDIAPEGVEEAKIAGNLILDYKISIDICFSSYLKRAIRTGLIILETADMMQIDIIKSWKLNERNYGAWQGRKKAEVEQEVGEALFTKIRRGYSIPPPKLSIDDERHPRFEEKYKDVDPAILPKSESLEDTKKRAVQYYFEAIVPELVKNKTVLVSAHGNSIRALMAEIETISAVEISKVEVQTGILNIYEFDSCMFLENKYQLEEKKEVFV
jgi:2,3-bisphosphoglycerate-dependent phosphoglycerate mutase